MRGRRSDFAVCKAYFASVPEMLFEMFSVSISVNIQSVRTELKFQQLSAIRSQLFCFMGYTRASFAAVAYFAPCSLC